MTTSVSVNSSQSSRSFFGYRVVFALALTTFGPVSFGHSCAGIFYPSAAAELGVGVGMLSYFLPIACITAFISLPFLGKAIAVIDARICVIGSLIVTATAFTVVSFAQSLWLYLAGGAIMGVGTATLIYLAPSTLVNRWFFKRAGFFIGLVMAFTGIGGVLWSAVGGVLIQEWGWSWTYRFFAIICLLMIPLMWFCIANDPSKKGQTAYGMPQNIGKKSDVRAVDADSDEAFSSDACNDIEANDESESEDSADRNTSSRSSRDEVYENRSMTASQAFRTPEFYLIFGFCFCLNFGMYLNSMIPSYVSTLAIGVAIPLLGALSTSLSMAAQTGSKLILGVVGDRAPFGGAVVGASCGLVGIALLIVGSSSVPVFACGAVAFGFYYGVVNVMTPILTRRCFGNKDYPIIYSRVSMAATISGVASGFLWGTLIDVSGGYSIVFVGVALFILIAILCAVGVGLSQKKRAKQQ